MARYSDTLLDQYQRPIGGVLVLVSLTSTGTIADLTDDGGNDLPNPLLTYADGTYSFNVDPGIYDLVFRLGGREIDRQTSIVIGDVSVLPPGSVADFLGTSTTVAPSQRAVNALGTWTTTPAQPANRSVQDRLGDLAVSILDQYAPTDTDFTNAAQRVLASGKNLFLPPLVGGYPIHDGLSMSAAGQQIISDGAHHGYFRATSDFNLSASGIISILPGESEYQAGLTNVGIVCDQPAAPASAAQLVKYPYAINAPGVSRLRFNGSIRIEGAWDGLNFNQNVGGLIADAFEVCAYNQAYTFDGALDSVHINTLKLWPYIAANTPQSLALYYAGKGGFVGRIDGLDIKTIAHFGQSLLMDTGTGVSGIGTIGSIQLDGAGSHLSWANHRYRVGSMYSTAAQPGTSAIIVTGGNLGIGGLYLQGNGRDASVGPNPPAPVAPLIYLGGGQLQIVNPDILAFGSAQSVIQQAGGVLDWEGGVFNAYSDVVYQAPLMNIMGGCAKIHNPRFLPGSGTANVGISVTADNWHDVEINAMMGWTRSVPASPSTSTFRFGSTLIGGPPL